MSVVAPRPPVLSPEDGPPLALADVDVLPIEPSPSVMARRESAPPHAANTNPTHIHRAFRTV
jgi:hypothetical protein